MHSRDVGAHEVDGTTRKHRDAIAFAAANEVLHGNDGAVQKNS